MYIHLHRKSIFLLCFVAAKDTFKSSSLTSTCTLSPGLTCPLILVCILPPASKMPRPRPRYIDLRPFCIHGQGRYRSLAPDPSLLAPRPLSSDPVLVAVPRAAIAPWHPSPLYSPLSVCAHQEKTSMTCLATLPPEVSESRSVGAAK